MHPSELSLRSAKSSGVGRRYKDYKTSQYSAKDTNMASVFYQKTPRTLDTEMNVLVLETPENLLQLIGAVVMPLHSGIISM